jgi:hypothetical protein
MPTVDAAHKGVGTMSIKPILCARCNVAANGPSEPQSEDIFACPKCGASDTFENIKRSLGEQATEYFAREFQRTIGDAFRQSKNIDYTFGAIPQGTHNFIVRMN